MQPEDDPPLTLSKWPFYLGDILLVSTALAIAILNGWNLSDWQVASCVVAVALGAFLFVLPFVVEYYLRFQEISDDRKAEIRVLRRSLEQVGAYLHELESRVQQVEQEKGSSPTDDPMVFEAVDKKLEGFREELSALQGALSGVEKKLAKPAKPDSSLKKEIEALRERLGSLETKAPKASGEAKPATEPAVKEEPEKAAKRAPRKPRERRASSSELLHRAIKDKEDKSTKAVDRIIDSGPKVPKEKAREKTETKEPPPVKPEPVETSAVEEAVPEEPKPPKVKEAVAKEPPPAKPKVEETVGSKADPMPEPVEDAKIEAAADEGPDLDAEVPPLGTEDMLFDEVATPKKPGRARAKKNDTVFTVNALIGIGNKPFLRGSGGGLSWDKGVAMEFQEIGKWRWIAPADLEGPLEVQVYRNDEDPDTAGRHTLEPGGKFEVSPSF